MPPAPPKYGGPTSKIGFDASKVFPPPRDTQVALVRARWLRIRPDARHVLELDLGLVTLPHEDADRLFVPGSAAVGRPAHPDAIRAGPMSPVRGQAVFLDRKKGQKDLALVVEGERDVTAGASAFAGGLDGCECAPSVRRVRGPASGGADDLIRAVGIDRDRRLAADVAGWRDRHD